MYGYRGVSVRRGVWLTPLLNKGVTYLCLMKYGFYMRKQQQEE
jgi:hypothetical protein